MEDKYSVIGTERGFERVISEGMSFDEALAMADTSRKHFDQVSISLDYSMRKPSQNMLVFSDVEQMLPELKRLLNDRPESLNEQLVFLGNFISGHDGFTDFMDYLLRLKDAGTDMVLVRGKNEHNALEAIHSTYNYVGDKKDASALIYNIEQQLGYPLASLKENSPRYYHLLNDSYSYFENDKHIFVSGGVNLMAPWRESSPEDFYMTSDTFLSTPNTTNKTIVFGNKSVDILNGTSFKKPWIQTDQRKIGINGTVRNYGRLIALCLMDGDRYFIGVNHRKRRKRTYAYDTFKL